LGDLLKKIIKISIIALLCCAALSFSSLAAYPPAVKSLGLNQLKESKSVLNAGATNSPNKAVDTPAPVQQENISILRQDSGTNLSIMNITFASSLTYGSGQTVRFTAPKPGWKLENVLVMASDGWVASSKQLPNPLPFAIEIRDANLRLLYHFADTQLPYFTSGAGVRLANVELPGVLVNGDFFVCFYSYRALGLAAELKNVTGNSYYFDKLTGQLYPSFVPMKNNQTLPVNWIIRVAGQ
jgi:hypothetical protein